MNNCDFNSCFKGVENISQDLLLNILEANFKMYLDWSFLKIGSWINAEKPNSTIYGKNNHFKLIPVDDISYSSGQVWQGIRKDWVWETNINYGSDSPIVISSISIDGSVVPKAGNFVVNYPNGLVIFNSPISASAVVELNYSYRFVQVHRSSESPWFNLIQYSSFNTANEDIQQINTGEWAIGSHHRIQLPCIIIEAIPRSRSRPYELGNSLLWLEQDLVFYVLAENKNDRNKLLDIIRLQQDATLQLFDTNKVAQDDAFPLDYNGDIKSTPLMYPNLIDQYSWRKCFIKNVNLVELDSKHTNFHQGAARATLEIIST
jgi:hypothetical protein